MISQFMETGEMAQFVGDSEQPDLVQATLSDHDPGRTFGGFYKDAAIYTVLVQAVLKKWIVEVSNVSHVDGPAEIFFELLSVVCFYVERPTIESQPPQFAVEVRIGGCAVPRWIVRMYTRTVG